MRRSGIYKIEHIASGRVYVGSAVRIDLRWYIHRHHLRLNTHHSPYLQRAWNKYGETAFAFSVLEYVTDKDTLIQREQHWMDSIGAATRPNFNISPTAGSALGVTRSAETLAKDSEASRRCNKAAHMNTPEATAKRVASARSQETRMKMSAAAKVNADKTSARFKGVPKSTETRLKMSRAAKNRAPDVAAGCVARMRAPDAAEKRRASLRSPRIRAIRSEAAIRNNSAARLQTPEVIAKRVATRKRNNQLRIQQESLSTTHCP